MTRTRAHAPHPAPGFTLLEILVVMGLMAILMGIGVGYLQNIGAGSRIEQARAIIRETLYACQQSSNGGTKAIFDLRQMEGARTDKLVVGAAVARPVLTHNFERLDSTSSGYELDVDGDVEIAPEGYIGHAAKFASGGRLVFEPQSAFAMTEGLRIDVWLKPKGGSPTMTVLEGEGAYDLLLQRDPKTDTYDVVLNLDLVEADRGRQVGVKTTFRTKGGPVVADAGWTQLQVDFDGIDVSIRVNGLEARARKPRVASSGGATPSEPSGPKRLVVPGGGAVKLVLGSANASYIGLMDTLVLGGIFRSSDVEREIEGLNIVSPNPPVRIVYRNGRLDPDVHTTDVRLILEEAMNEGGPVLEFRIGLYGTIDERLGTSGP